MPGADTAVIMKSRRRSAGSEQSLGSDKDHCQDQSDQPCHQKKALRHVTWRIEFSTADVTGESAIVYSGAFTVRTLDSQS
jgi:hypothetical protein